jgi:single-stranded-DNA-specific exonuclease
MFNTPSLTGKKWVFKEAPPRVTQTLVQKLGLDLPLADLLASRGYDSESAPDYLAPTLKRFLPDPSLLKDMDKAVLRTIQAIELKEHLAIYGDYDVDGATSSALLRRYFFQIGVHTRLYIPDRIEEGYGANAEALELLAQEGIKLTLMVDCGTTAFEPLDKARQKGMDIIVLDHHTAEPRLPEASAIVNPNRLDQEWGDRQDLKYICAAGVSFLFLVALNRALRRQGFFKDRDEPDLRQFLDLVALGTVCDVMPLNGLNRAFVKQGLEVARKRQNLGMKTLADVAGVKDRLGAYHLGFVVGPRINAGGRVGKSDLGSRLLTSGDTLETLNLAQELDFLNKQRQEIEKSVLEQAIQTIEQNNLHRKSLILVGAEGWHPGVIGIVASRLKEKYHKPACVVAFDEKEGKGSGRSLPGVEMGLAMIQAVNEGLLLKGGGHAMAAGFTVLKDKFSDFYTFLEAKFRPFLENTLPEIRVDIPLSLQGLTLDFVRSLEQLEPFGAGNPTPKVVLNYLRPAYAQVVGENHLRVELADESGKRLKAMAFRSLGTPLGEELLKPTKALYHVLGTAKIDTWNSTETLTFIIEDIMGA